MRLAKLFAVSAGAMAASATLISPRTVDENVLTHLKKQPPFFVEVVANGVPLNGVPYEPNRDHKGEFIGLDLWIGAITAYDDLKRATNNQELPFALEPNDDKDNVDSARSVATKIQAEPRVLSVIGHGITATTHAAAKTYAQAGIPLIVALATADSAVTGEGESSRLPISYRLSPSDSRVQAPAIAYFIRTHLPPDLSHFDVHLLISKADQAEAYARPLCQQTSDILVANNFSTTVSSLDSIPDAIGEITGQHDPGDFIVYCGYAKEAIQLMQGLSGKSTAGGTDLPQVILSSAVQQEDVEHIQNLRVFRMAPLNTDRCSDKEALKRLSDAASKVHRPLTPEQIHGYDAVQVIAAAARKCTGRLSRSCVLKELERGDTLPSICSDYSFRDGENIISDFFVFPAGSLPQRVATSNSPCNNAQAITLTPPEVLHMLRATDQVERKSGR
jgi:ABC-type branched-subunit amino acid transport system substrate-binding protein